MPFFSVLIPSYNRPELIAIAVQSVLDGDFSDFEIIVSDDKSPRQAEIAAVLAPFTHDPRVQVHLQPANLREAANRDFLLRTAHGEWQIILCDDDKLSPHALKTLAAAIHQYPGAEIYAFGYRLIDEHDRCAYSRRAPSPLRVSIAQPLLARELFASDAFPFWLFHPATFCAHRSVRERIRPNSHIGIGDDMMFLMDFINAGGVLQIVPSVLMDYRKFSAKATNAQINQSAGEAPNLISRALILQHLVDRTDLRPELADYVCSLEFRRRFLFDPAVWSGALPEGLDLHFTAHPEIYAELCAYVGQMHPRLRRLQLLSGRASFFLSTFGLGGLCEISKVFFQRLFSRAR
jgi:hypothetical protein